MQANVQEIKRLLKEQNFREIFRDELGWDHQMAAPEVVTYKNQDYHFTYLAGKAGFKIYLHTFPERIPNEQTLKQLDQRLRYAAEEHLTIFADAAHENQAWLWVKRKSGQPNATRLNRLNKNQSGELLAQKIARLFVSIDTVGKLFWLLLLSPARIRNERDSPSKDGKAGERR